MSASDLCYWQSRSPGGPAGLAAPTASAGASRPACSHLRCLLVWAAITVLAAAGGAQMSGDHYLTSLERCGGDGLLGCCGEPLETTAATQVDNSGVVGVLAEERDVGAVSGAMRPREPRLHERPPPRRKLVSSVARSAAPSSAIRDRTHGWPRARPGGRLAVLVHRRSARHLLAMDAEVGAPGKQVRPQSTQVRWIVPVAQPPVGARRLASDPLEPVEQSLAFPVDVLGAHGVGVVDHVEVERLDADVPERAVGEREQQRSTPRPDTPVAGDRGRRVGGRTRARPLARDRESGVRCIPVSEPRGSSIRRGCCLRWRRGCGPVGDP